MSSNTKGITRRDIPAARRPPAPAASPPAPKRKSSGRLQKITLPLEPEGETSDKDAPPRDTRKKDGHDSR
jgi:hypothetical protein